MKRYLPKLACICLCTITMRTAQAQITITTADVGAQLAFGNTTASHQDTLTTSLNIGSLGATSWDFSSLLSNTSTTLTSVDPATTPYASQFSGATNAIRSAITVQGISGIAYQYLTLSTNLQNPGSMGGASTILGEITVKSTNSPSAITYGLPATLGTAWNASYTETMVFALNGSPISTSSTNYVDSAWVDAYGPMTIPGGATYDALRIRVVSYNPAKSVSYIFTAKNGASVQIRAANPASPNSGVITIDTTSTVWTGPTSVDVAEEAALPTAYALLQNYPNPFNPTTEITYLLPQTANVHVSIFDALGRQVAVLVDGDQPAGTHTVSFNGAGLASGVYLYRLQAGSYVQMRKMVLVK